MTSRSTSAVEEASASTRLTSPKRELSWWWSTLIVYGDEWSDRRVGAEPALVRAVDGEQHPLARVLRQLAQKLAEREEAGTRPGAAPGRAGT